MDIEISKKSVTCPVCNHDFTATRIITTGLKLIKTDTDLRPHYEGINTIPYEITTCENCGYSNYFKEFPLNIPKNEINNIKKNLSNKFKPKLYPEHLTTLDGMEKYRLAILSARCCDTEKSKLMNLYMKLSWLARDNDITKDIELKCIKYAYKLGKEAIKEETFPVQGINKSTFSYLLGEFARRLKLYDEAIRWLRNAESLQESSLSLKDRIEEVSKLISIDMANEEQENLIDRELG